MVNTFLTLLHSEKPNLCTILAFLSAVGLNRNKDFNYPRDITNLTFS